jgi:N-acetylglutamate synthase-like GNAT family acetyltransferase
MGIDNVHVRKARVEDLDAIKALADANKASLGFVLRPVLAAGIQRDWLLVAERAGQVIGFVHHRHRQDSQTTLYEICVDEASRRNGVGRSLVQALTAESRSLGKIRVCLKAPADLPANEFYRQLGFALTDVQQGKRRQLNVWETWLDGGEGRA